MFQHGLILKPENQQSHGVSGFGQKICMSASRFGTQTTFAIRTFMELGLHGRGPRGRKISWRQMLLTMSSLSNPLWIRCAMCALRLPMSPLKMPLRLQQQDRTWALRPKTYRMSSRTTSRPPALCFVVLDSVSNPAICQSSRQTFKGIVNARCYVFHLGDNSRHHCQMIINLPQVSEHPHSQRNERTKNRWLVFGVKLSESFKFCLAGTELLVDTFFQDMP